MDEIVHNQTGRIQGSVVRKKLSADERMDAIRAMGLECDPLMILMEIASGKVLQKDGTVVKMIPPPEQKDRVKAASELASYVYPKRKAMEITGNEGKPISFAVVMDNDAPPPIPESHRTTISAQKTPPSRRLAQGESILIEVPAEEPAD
jgi:hypothetical protein